MSDASEPAAETVEQATGEVGPDEPTPDEPRDKGTMARESLAAVSSCGVFGGMAFLGCFPVFLLASLIALWWVPVQRFMEWGQSPAINLLDDIAMAEERWAGAHDGAFLAAPPCPAELPGDAPAPFPGDCALAWTELDLDRFDLPCRVTVELADAGFVATAECPSSDGPELWQVDERGKPHRVRGDR